MQIDAALGSHMDETVPIYGKMKQELELSNLILVYLDHDTIDDLIDTTQNDPDHELNQRVQQLCDDDGMTFEEYYISHIEQRGYEYGTASCSNATMSNATMSNAIKTAVLNHMEEEPEDYLNLLKELTRRLKGLMEQVLNVLFGDMVEVLNNRLEASDIGLTNRSILFHDENHQELYVPLQEEVVLLEGIETEQVEDLIQEGILEPIQQIIGEENQALEGLWSEKQEKVNKVDQEIQIYSPFEQIDYGSLEKIKEDLFATNQLITEKMDGKQDEFITFADTVNQTAYETIHQMQEEIRLGNEKANETLGENLEEVKKARAELNKETDELTSGFVAKLPYTRLGNGPFSAAYEFIVEPAEFKTSSELKAEQLKIKTEQDKAKRLLDTQDLYVIGMACVMLLLGTVLIQRYLWMDKKKKSEEIRE
jgi:hypothetical protein